MRGSRQALLMLASALLAAASLGCSRLPWQRAADAPRAVTVLAVQGTLEIRVPAEGTLEAVNASPIAVPVVPVGSLKVKEIVPEGSLVAEGDVVVAFDESQLAIELENNKASFRSVSRRTDRTRLQSGIELGSIDVMRDVAQLELEDALAFDITDETVFSKLEILESRVREREASETIVFAKASVRLRGEVFDIEERILGVERGQVEGTIDRVETSLAQVVLRAPLPGMVVYRKNWRGAATSVGDTVRAGNVILSIVDPTVTLLKAYVLERDAALVETGAAVTVTVDARRDHPLEGRVTSLAVLSAPIERGSPVKYFEAVIELPGADASIARPGMRAVAQIHGARVESAVLVPRSAVRGEPDAPQVVVVTEAGNVPRPVKLGPGDQVRVSIAEGLAAGERVLLQPGEKAAGDEERKPEGDGDGRRRGRGGRGGGGGPRRGA